MIATITFAFDMDDLLDALDLELLDEEHDAEFDVDDDGIIWFYDEDMDVWLYFDEDLDDWAEIDEDGTVWYLDEEDDVVYYYDEESDEWIEYDGLDEEEDDSASW
jgi:hypothetical protein